MAYSRYTGRSSKINNDDGYQKTFFDDRDVKQIMQYETARFYYPNFQERVSMDTRNHIWTATSKLYNLADEFYGAPQMWWLIAWFNKKPTEAHFKVGDAIQIPTDATQALIFFERQSGRV